MDGPVRYTTSDLEKGYRIMMTSSAVAFFPLLMLSTVACSKPAEKKSEEGVVTSQEAEARGEQGAKPPAVVDLKPTQGHKVMGRLTLTPEKGGVRLRGTISGLPGDSKNGFHVHEKGDCSAPDASSAGEHFNPLAGVHGKEASGDHHHVGDMDNLSTDSKGNAKVDMKLEGATLGGGATTDIMGRSVIVHIAPDDYKTQPSGGSGARVACGVITAG
jgi:Cu-Zn family superoxide dismutase